MKKILVMTVALCALMASPAEARRHRSGGLPWCGIFMMEYTGIHKPGLALARNWASVGSNAGGPCVGCIVVWPHHVGKIVGHDGKNWIVHSGNDGGRVRTRPRSVAGAIAFRRV